VIFTSVNGVTAFLARLAATGQAVGGVRIAAIGPATAAALTDAGLPPDFVPGTYVAEAIVTEIGDVAGQHILLPRADLARPALAAGLHARGAIVDEVTAYRTVPAPDLGQVVGLLQAGQVDAMTFTSSSTVRYFLQGVAAAGFTLADWQFGPQRPAIVCIGPITAGTARDHGLPVDVVADEYTTDGLIMALLDWFAATSAERRS
jgi:uroporphyrinogen-III synthase